MLFIIDIHTKEHVTTNVDQSNSHSKEPVINTNSYNIEEGQIAKYITAELELLNTGNLLYKSMCGLNVCTNISIHNILYNLEVVDKLRKIISLTDNFDDDFASRTKT